MNWKTKVVLLFAKLRKPLDPKKDVNINAMRKQAQRAAKLGTKLFDSYVKVAFFKNEIADGIPVRIYKDAVTDNLPVMIYYHGGGFVLYDIESHDNVCRRLCKMNNCVVVSVDYRLAPEHTFPAAHEDAFTAIQWVKKSIVKYGGNAEKLIVAGDSAGGNLAACMAHRCKKENITLLAQVLIYPWIDGKLNYPSIDRNGEGYMLTKPTMFWFQKQYTPRVEDRCHPLVSPIYESEFENLAPCLILTAEYDPLIDDGIYYYNKLKSANNKVVYKEYKALIHGFFNLPYMSRNCMNAYDDIQSFLKHYVTENTTAVAAK
jgi:acetyl esterase